MAKQIKTEISINATPEKIWAVLTDFEKYPEWNPFIQSLTGAVAVGNTIKARIVPPGAGGMTFTPKVLIFDSNREFRWRGKLFIPGLFDGEHYFQIKTNPESFREDGTCTFIHGEHFSGILVGLFGKAFYANVQKGFEAMNEKLKARAEGK